MSKRKYFLSFSNLCTYLTQTIIYTTGSGSVLTVRTVGHITASEEQYNQP